MRFVLLALAILAWSAGPIVPPAPSRSVAPAAAPDVADYSRDFEALHAQASSALERLRERHMPL